MFMKNLISKGTYPIFFRGSNRTYNRVLYYNPTTKRYYCKWYGNLIEVTRDTVSGYPATVEDY